MSDTPQLLPPDPTAKTLPAWGAPTVAAGEGPRSNVPRSLGPYQLLDELGQGGMGVVFRARHTQLGSECAVKVLIAGEHASPESIARFRREAAAVAKMGKHPNIATVFDLGEEGALSYYAMELVEGKTLRRRLAERAYSPREAAALVEKVARALHFAHTHGVIHRDVKPENIVIREELAPSEPGGASRGGEPQVMDFGLAKDVGATARLSLTGQVMGTPAYMAPEQVRGDVSATDARTDVYALGAVLYELLAGVPPHGGDDLAAIFASVLAGEVVPPRRLRPGLPRDVETVCLKCLEADPSRRYSSAEALAEDLARFQRGEAVQARPVGWLGLLARRVRRRPLVSALVAAIVVAAIVIPALAWKRTQEKKAAARDLKAAEQRREQAVADALAQLNVTGEALVEASLARRALGDLAGSRRNADLLWPSVTKLKEEAPLLAEPWYHEGRMLRALQRDDDAERAQDKAVQLASLPDATEGSRAVRLPALYERAVLRTLRWQRTLQKRRTDWLQVRSAAGGPQASSAAWPTDDDIAKAYPEVATTQRLAEEDLREMNAGPGADRRLLTTTAALASFVRGDTEADGLLRRASKEDPDRIELYLFRASLLERGNPEEAARCYEEAHERDRGYLECLTRGAESLQRAAELAPSHAPELMERALKLADAALSMDDGCLHAWISRSSVLIRQAMIRDGSGRDAEAGAAYASALEACDRALSLDPEYEGVAINQAFINQQLGQREARRGGDPSAEYQKALDVLQRAVALRRKAPLGPLREADLYDRVGSTWVLIGDTKRAHGGDASAEYRNALAALGQALALCPLDRSALSDRANVHGSLGDAMRARGEDACAEYQEALADIDKALSMEPTSPQFMNNRAVIYYSLGQAKRARGEDASAEFQNAREGFERAFSADPRYLTAACNAAKASRMLGDGLSVRPRDASAEYQKALKGYDQVLSCDRRYEEAILGRTSASLALATLAFRRGDGAEARGLCEQAIPPGTPEDGETRPVLQECHLRLARVLSLASAGKAGPSAEGTAVGEEEASLLRDLAIEHLRRAVRLGYVDAKGLSENADLAPLHEDPRWAELLRRLPN